MTYDNLIILIMLVVMIMIIIIRLKLFFSIIWLFPCFFFWPFHCIQMCKLPIQLTATIYWSIYCLLPKVIERSSSRWVFMVSEYKSAAERKFIINYYIIFRLNILLTSWLINDFQLNSWRRKKPLEGTFNSRSTVNIM